RKRRPRRSPLTSPRSTRSKLRLPRGGAFLLTQLRRQVDDVRVGRELLEPLEEHVQLLLAVPRLPVQEPAQALHGQQLRGRVEQLLAAGAGGRNVHRG